MTTAQRVAVAGVVTVRVARGFDSFPIPYVSSTCETGGISVRLGGAGWTLARTLQLLGTDVTFATYVGADALGELAVGGLRRCGMYGPATQVCDVQPRVMVLYDADGRRASASDLRSTPDLRYPADSFQSLVDSGPPCAAAVLTNIGFTRSLIPVAADRGIPIVTDLHLVGAVDCAYNRDWMASAHVLACSHERLPCRAEDWVRSVWQRFGTDLVLVGCGPGGAVLGVRATGRIWHIQPAVPRGVRYTSGAGDTLLGSFTHHYFALGDPVAAVRHAVLTAGWKVGGTPDDDPGVPADELRDLRTRHGLPEVVTVA
ncbi:carbohydrate kinase family protein [Amycolatopsis anabasis]|uniref:carbohydrate kinase family protein n=1 Tax=Amycolatopsis anabasis TaxID=1840409 RepID=UPI00131C9395|nr:carbohydrate kinase family protein [Amycolatopsis anabasis]